MYSTDGYRALRASSAAIRREDRGVLVVSGADRSSWLQGLVTNDVTALRPGESQYAAYLTPQGRMISDMRIVALRDRMLLEVAGGLAESLRAKLDSLLFAEDAQIADMSGTLAVIDVHGPSSADVVERARGLLDMTAIDVIRDDVYRVPGQTFFVEREKAQLLVQALREAGALETTLETLDVIRIEAGVPQFLVDMDEHTIPLEAGIEQRAISFTKGCYVGQEVIVRVTHRGHGRVAKKLVGVRFEKDAAPRPRDVIVAAEREIGQLTSATWSPVLEGHIALGSVHRDFTDPGTSVQVRTTSGIATATVTQLPFVKGDAARTS